MSEPMSSRRSFLLAASGLLVPEWLLDPPNGRAMVSVPWMAKESVVRLFAIIGLPNGSIVQEERHIYTDGTWRKVATVTLRTAGPYAGRRVSDFRPEAQP